MGHNGPGGLCKNIYYHALVAIIPKKRVGTLG